MKDLPDQRGFTLVEMLVALSLFAMIAAIGVGLLRASINTQDAVQTRLQMMGGVNRLRAIMGHDLAAAVPRPTRSETGRTLAAFSGSGNGFALVSRRGAALGNPARPDVLRIAYALVGDEWRRAVQPILDGTAMGEGDRIVGEVSGVKLRYRAADGAWLANWAPVSEDQMPTAVEVTLLRTAHAPLVLRFLVAPSPPPTAPGRPS